VEQVAHKKLPPHLQIMVDLKFLIKLPRLIAVHQAIMGQALWLMCRIILVLKVQLVRGPLNKIKHLKPKLPLKKMNQHRKFRLMIKKRSREQLPKLVQVLM
jgi:hypothetical protein